jgi:hypothetical protein
MFCHITQFTPTPLFMRDLQSAVEKQRPLELLWDTEPTLYLYLIELCSDTHIL